jgi:hypothetical protein
VGERLYRHHGALTDGLSYFRPARVRGNALPPGLSRPQRPPCARPEDGLSFGHFTIDFAQRLLVGAGVEVRLGNKEFDLLRLLIERRGPKRSPRTTSSAACGQTPSSARAIWRRSSPACGWALGDNPRGTQVHSDGVRLRLRVRRRRRSSLPRLRTTSAPRWALVCQNRLIPLTDGVHVLGRSRLRRHRRSSPERVTAPTRV